MSGGLVVGEVFAAAARAVPQRTAAVLGDRRLTFAELDDAADRTARALAARGVAPGDRVLCWASTSLDVLAVFAALARLGAVFAPLGPGLTVQEAEEVGRAARPAAIVADATVDAAKVAAALSVPHIDLGALTAEAAAQEAVPPDVPGPAESDPHVIFFTSGSTGAPKGVVLSHRVNVLRSHPGSQVEPRGAMVCPYPLFHMGAWTIALQQWQARDTLVLLPDAEGATVVQAVREHSATRLNAVPAVWRRVLDHLAAEDGERTLPSLRFADSGTSATPPELLEAVAAAAPGAVLRVFYGSTEAGNVTSLHGEDVLGRPGSCGVPSVWQEVALDPDSELCVRGPLLFDGYFDDTEATEAAVQDGWYRTGDLATMDDDGYFTISGRARDLIRTGGESVAPSEVERVLAEVEGVKEVAVIGLPDVTWGEIVCAVVVPEDGERMPGPKALRDRCEGRLAGHKHPRRVFYAQELPRTGATGQVQRKRLVEDILAARGGA